MERSFPTLDRVLRCNFEQWEWEWEREREREPRGRGIIYLRC